MRIQQKIRVDDDDTHDGRHERKLNDSTTAFCDFSDSILFEGDTVLYTVLSILCHTAE